MTILRVIGAVVLLLFVAAGLFFAIGSVHATKWRGQAVFVSGWSLALIAGLAFAQQY